MYLEFEANESLAQAIQEKLYALPYVQETFIDAPPSSAPAFLLSGAVVLVTSRATELDPVIRCFIGELAKLRTDLKGLDRVLVTVGAQKKDITSLTDADFAELAGRELSGS